MKKIIQSSPFINVEKVMIQSPAFWKLTGTAKNVLFLFLYRRQYERAGRNGKWYPSNDGEIVFSYIEAEKKYNISRSSFARAIDQLIKLGFIDIAHLGGGMVKDCSKYSISKRWGKYGTDQFIIKTRPKDNRGLGFRSENWETVTGKKRSIKSKQGIKNDTALSIKNVTGRPTKRGLSSIKIDTEEIDLNYFYLKGLDVISAFSTLSNNNVTVL